MHPLFSVFSGHVVLVFAFLMAFIGHVQASTQQTQAEQRYLAWKQRLTVTVGDVFATAGSGVFRHKDEKPQTRCWHPDEPPAPSWRRNRRGHVHRPWFKAHAALFCLRQFHSITASRRFNIRVLRRGQFAARIADGNTPSTAT